jgi:dTDP-4-dehydrorhamnose 3,5-epimerase
LKRPIDDFGGVEILEAALHSDSRGYLYKQGIPSGNTFTSFLLSHNPTAGTVRGLHCQPRQDGEHKLITCIRGAIVDYLLDLREDSATFGDWCEYRLSEKATKSLLVPPGLAHGFQTIEGETTLHYLVSGEYIPENSITINIQDSELGINLPMTIAEISQSDLKAISFKEALGKLNLKP